MFATRPVISGEFPPTLSRSTRRVYDALSAVYPISTMLFHSQAHRHALEMSGIEDGMRVLEVATGSGEMFRRLARVNPNGRTVGIDLSPNMASRTQRDTRRRYPRAAAYCQAVDARSMPYRDHVFDRVVCCYLLELLSAGDICKTVSEFHRVLRRNGRLTLILIGENAPFFNAMYRVCTRVAPAFWGRQVEKGLPDLISAHGFQITADEKVKQIFYPSRVLVAKTSLGD